MGTALFKLTIKKESDQDIKIEGEIKSGGPMNMSSRMYIAKETIPIFISTLQNITPELAGDPTHRPIKNSFDDIGFAIEGYENGDLLTVVNNHLKSDGTIDNYGLLDIPYIFHGTPNSVHIDELCKKLQGYML